MLLSLHGIFLEGYYLLTYSLSPLPANDPTPLHIQAEVTMKTNFFGTRDVCTELLPLMRPQGRLIVNQISMGSESIQKANVCSVS